MLEVTPKLIWFTGLSGAGKTTLSKGVHNLLKRQHLYSVLLDGDEIRKTINKDLGFSHEDRTENLRRVAEISLLLLQQNLFVIGAFISPLITDREMVKNIIGDDNFIEVYVNTPLHICEQRDIKGLYKKARNNELKNFTGISSIYEAPPNPDFIINASNSSIDLSVQEVFEFLNQRIRG